ncbi:MAG TPA: PDZ domain-containing protein [Candidatus Eremiobacteraceae bacterium]|nr:PDZ domain-containing protein [Candidatus Eremiobacteraceae bacterium]
MRCRILARVAVVAVLVLFCCGTARAARQPMTLLVDAREAPRNIIHAQMTIPVTAGDLTLYYPKWIPGEHGPTGPLNDLAALHVEGGGATLSWQRDLVDQYAFHIRVPAGVTSLAVSFDFLMTQDDVIGTPDILVLNWNRALLYPAGAPVSDIPVTPSIILPQGWQYDTALPSPARNGPRVDFGTISLERLVDSPLDAGRYVRQATLLDQPDATNEIHIFAATPADLDFDADMVAKLKNLVTQADDLYGARHWTHYHFLLTLSDAIAPEGIEHHESSDNREIDTYLTDPKAFDSSADLLPHEFSHSWNGKYRRPADLTTTDYQEPEKTDLLWIYEGLNQYIGDVLSYRSGLRDPKEYPDYLAGLYAGLDYEPGRLTTPLSEVAVAAPYLYEAPRQWTQERRTTDDFYDEGELVWLDADTLIRQASNGSKSLDTFMKGFFGPPSTPPMVRTYTYGDVVAALNAVQPYDWDAFFKTRVYTVMKHPPSEWLARAGYRLTFNDVPNATDEIVEEARNTIDLRYSIGVVVRSENDDSSPGEVGNVLTGSPAAIAGLGAGMKIVAVNWRAFSADSLHAAVKASRGTTAPITLIVQSGKTFALISIDYHGGERFPHLERTQGTPDMLAAITAPR